MKKSTGETYPELGNDDDDKMTRELLSIKMKTFYVCIGTKKTRMRERESVGCVATGKNSNN